MACPLHVAVIRRRMSWEVAAERCSTLSTSTCTVRLGAILSIGEQTALKAIVREAGPQEHFWLSGRRFASEGEFRWHSTVNQAVTYAGWAPGEPTMVSSELCIVVNRFGEWHDNPCTSEFFALCESRTCGCTGYDSSVEYDVTASPTFAVSGFTRSPTFLAGGGSESEVGTTNNGSLSDGSLSTGGIIGIILAAVVCFVCALLLLRFARLKATKPASTPSKATTEVMQRLPSQQPKLIRAGRIPDAEVVQVPFATYENIPEASEMDVPEARALDIS